VIRASILSGILGVPGMVRSISADAGFSVRVFMVLYNLRFSCSASDRVTNDSGPKPQCGLRPS
jgi:hypothetical protein